MGWKGCPNNKMVMKSVFSISAEFKFWLSADTVGVWSMQNKQSRQCLVKNTAKL